MSLVIIFRAITLAFLFALLILHNNGVRRLVIFDLHLGVVFGLMHVLVHIVILGTGAVVIQLADVTNLKVVVGYSFIPGWYLITLIVSIKGVRYNMYTFRDFLFEAFHNTPEPSIRATLGSILRLVVAIIGYIPIIFYLNNR